MRLCLIGNSHLSAFRLALDHISLPDTITPTFFGAMRDRLRMVEPQHNRLVPTEKVVRDSFKRTSGGKGEIAIRQYDAFVLVGLSASMKRCLRFHRRHRWYGLQQGAETGLVRRNLALTVLTEEYSRTRLAELAQTLRLMTNKPIFAFAEPFWAARMRPPPPEITEIEANGTAIRQMFRESLTAALAGNAEFIEQPEETVRHACYSDDTLTITDIAAHGADPDFEDDPVHMNGVFAARCWQKLLARL